MLHKQSVAEREPNLMWVYLNKESFPDANNSILYICFADIFAHFSFDIFEAFSGVERERV